MEAILAVVNSALSTLGGFFEVQSTQNIEDASIYNNYSTQQQGLSNVISGSQQLSAAGLSQQRASALYASLIVLAVIAAITVVTLKTKK